MGLFRAIRTNLAPAMEPFPWRGDTVEVIPPQEIGDELVAWDGRCPDCGNVAFYDGPRAGICQNIECATCNTRLNVAFVPGHPMAQRL